MERSFVMVKPDGVRRGLVDEVIKRLEAGGLKIAARKEITATAEIVTQHYPLSDDYLLTLGHRDPSNWTDEEKTNVINNNRKLVESMHAYLQSGPVVPMIVEGPVGTVAKIREIVGKTNPADADKGTIRGDFGEDSYAKADEYEQTTGKKRPVENIVHASGSPEEAEAEIKIWFPELA